MASVSSLRAELPAGLRSVSVAFGALVNGWARTEWSRNLSRELPRFGPAATARCASSFRHHAPGHIFSHSASVAGTPLRHARHHAVVVTRGRERLPSLAAVPMSLRLGPNRAVNADPHRRGFARAAVAGYLDR